MYSDFGRLALDGMSKNSSVEDIRVAASARMGGVSVRGIYSNGRFVDGAGKLLQNGHILLSITQHWVGSSLPSD